MNHSTNTITLRRGYEHLARREWAAALTAFDEVQRADSDSVEASAGRGQALFGADKHEEAVEAFSNALTFRPNDPDLLRGRGKAHFENSDNESAIEDLDEVLQQRPDDAEAIAYRAAAYSDHDNPDLAYDELQRALALNPLLACAYFFRGRTLSAFNVEDAALADFSRAIELDPNYPYPYHYRAGIWDSLEENERAAADSETYLRLRPNGAAYHSRGHFWQGRGEYDKAVAAFAEAVRLEPDNTRHYSCRSGLFLEMGEDEKADSDLETIQIIELQKEGVNVTATLEERMRVFTQIQDHFGAVPLDTIEVTSREFPARVAADLQLALDRLESNAFEVPHFWAVRQHGSPATDFTQIYTRDRRSPPTPVPPEYIEINIGEDEPVRCLKFGLWLLLSEGVPLLVLLDTQNHRGINFQVAAVKGGAGQGAAQRFFRYLEETIQKGTCYRGKVLSLECQDMYSGQSYGILVHKLRSVQREEVILPGPTLTLLERNVIQFVRQRPRLSKFGLATKKGLLFYGPPGTGKTHTIHYLARGIEGQTTFLIAAEQVGLLTEYMTLARLFQPSMVVIEDVDLIARDRASMHTPGEEVLLNKLLNEMDGLKPETDILFVLTTNRPEKLEAALSSRPGRIDQAIEFPLPDEEGRAKLVRLYSREVEVPEEVVAVVVKKTDRVSASFIKELMRRATQFYLERDATGPLSVADVNNALEEMLFSGGSLNRVLLGAAVGDSDY